MNNVEETNFMKPSKLSMCCSKVSVRVLSNIVKHFHVRFLFRYLLSEVTSSTIGKGTSWQRDDGPVTSRYCLNTSISRVHPADKVILYLEFKL